MASTYCGVQPYNSGVVVPVVMGDYSLCYILEYGDGIKTWEM
jgi:hypothetical protein